MSRLAAIASLDDRGWRRDANCRGRDPRIFFEHALTAVARRICSGCAVRDACLDEAIADERDGVWGGATATERDRIAEQRRQAAERPARRAAVRRGHHYAVLAQLVDHPGRWAILDRYPNPNSGVAVASLHRNGQRPTPPGRWSFEARIDDETGGSIVYARYDGPGCEAVS